MLMTRYTLALVAFFLFASPLYAETERHIEVSGHGKIHSAPDIALLTLTFSQRHKQALHAKNTVDEQVTKLLALTKRLTIKDKDIQAAQLSIYPEYDHKNNRQLVGYNVSREVRIQLRDLFNYPKLLEGSVAIGATHTDQLQLDFSNREELENQALQAAFKDAKRQALLLTEVSGDQLGQTLWIHASGGHSPTPMRSSRMVMSNEADAGYPTGEMALSRQVQVRFSLQD